MSEYIPFYILLSITSALATRELNVHYKLGAVRASALVSLSVGLLVYFLGENTLYAGVAMGASFAAMSNEKVMPSRLWMVVCSMIFGLLFVGISHSFFIGLGGRLGAVAAISVVMTLGIMKVGMYINEKRKR